MELEYRYCNLWKIMSDKSKRVEPCFRRDWKDILLDLLSARLPWRPDRWRCSHKANIHRPLPNGLTLHGENLYSITKFDPEKHFERPGNIKSVLLTQTHHNTQPIRGLVSADSPSWTSVCGWTNMSLLLCVLSEPMASVRPLSGHVVTPFHKRVTNTLHQIQGNKSQSGHIW